MADRWHSPKDDAIENESTRSDAIDEELDRLSSLLSDRTAEQKDMLLYAVIRALLKGEGDSKEKGASPPINDDAAIDAAIEWLWAKWEKAHCPYCGEGPWEVEGPFSLQLDDEAALSPVFTVMCTNCGQTAFVSAVQAGVVGKPTADEDGR